MDFRNPLILAAAPAGLVLGVLIWLLAGGPGAASRRADEAAERLPARIAPADGAGMAAASLAQAKALPLIGLPAGQAPSIRVVGVARSPGRLAALLEVNSATPVWVTRGEGVGGMTLVGVEADGVVLENMTGQIEIKVGHVGGGEASAPAAEETGGTGG